MSVYNLRIFGSLFGQQVMNSFFFQDADGNVAPDSAELFGGWITDDVLGDILAVQSVNMEWISYEVINTDDFTDFTSGSLVGNSGLVTGDCLPSFATWSFIYNRASRAVRNGYKRFAGVPESMQVNGDPTSGALTLLNVLAVSLGNTVDVGGNGYIPCIAHKHTGDVPVYEAFPILNVTFLTIGTQNTRKVGRGG